MYGEAGLSYIYFIYSVYFCFNVSAVAAGVPKAVLIRALEPIEGLDFMKNSLSHIQNTNRLANGPGKLCLAIALKREQSNLDMTTSSNLWIEEAPYRSAQIKTDSIAEGPRIGLGSDHDAVHWPLRFGVQDHPCLSPPKFLY